MPGIVGIITRISRKYVEPELVRMVAALAHENFYVSGTCCDESLGLYVGWTARKESPSAEMPLRNRDGSAVLVFSGEEFSNVLATHDRDQKRIDPVSADTWHLMERYEREADFPKGLNGWFHGIIGDRRKGSVTLFNDRYGMNRIYYYAAKDAFYFAAEAKAILAIRHETRRIDSQRIGEFVACGRALEDSTLFEGVKVLPGASAWVFRNAALESKATYFNVREWDTESRLDPESYYREMRDCFARVLPKYFAGPHRIAMSLTGGLDSRMIMAWKRPASGSLPCYTFNGMYRECRDVQIARQVAKACNQTHEIITVGNDFLSRFPYYAERTVYLTDGCAEVSHSPDLYAHERAREIAPIRMTGNYGGEVLRGVWYFKASKDLPSPFHHDLNTSWYEARAACGTEARSSPAEVIVHRVSANLYGQYAIAESQLALRSPYLDNELVQAALTGSFAVGSGEKLCMSLIAERNPTLLEIPLDREQGRKGLGASFEQQVQNFLFKAEYAYDCGMPHWLARLDHIFPPLHLERLFLGRHKWYHFRIWYRDVLSSYLRELLLDKRTLSRPYLSASHVESMVQEHLKAQRNHTNEIHKVLSLELLHRTLIDTVPPHLN